MEVIPSLRNAPRCWRCSGAVRPAAGRAPACTRRASSAKRRT